jgi:nitrite reductase (NADH) small subunit
MTSPRHEAHDLGPEDEFELDIFRIFELSGLSVGVVRTQSGWYAIRNRCPHQLAPLCRGVVTGTMLPGAPDEMHFGMAGQVVRCPWHGWEYDLETGKSVFATSRTKVATYPVTLDRGRVSVLLPPPRPTEGEDA